MIEILRNLFKYYGPKYKQYFILLIPLCIIASLMDMSAVLLIFPFIQILSGEIDYSDQQNIVAKIYQTFNFENESQLITCIAIAIISIFILKNLYMVCFLYLQKQVLHKMRVQISNTLMQKFTNMQYTQYITKPFSYFLNIIKDAVPSTTHLFLPGIITCIANLLVTFTIVSFLLYKYFYAIFVASVVFVILIKIQSYFLRASISEYKNNILPYNQKLTQTVQEPTDNFEITRLFNKKAFFLKKHNAAINNLTKIEGWAWFINSIALYFSEIIVMIAIMSMCYILFAKNGTTGIADLGLIIGAIFRIYPLVNRSIVSFNTCLANEKNVKIVIDEFIALERIEKLYNEKDHSIIRIKKELKLQDLHFSYSKSKESAISNINLTIKKGEFIGLVGKSGAGKSTLSKILISIIPPDSGSIFVDSTKITRENIAGLRKNTAYVPQEIKLLHASIKENIAFGCAPEDINQSLLNKAIKDSQLKEFCNSFDDKEDHVISSPEISGGQKQRIAIARALYANTDIIILDEATSSLDLETEHEIAQSIGAIKGKKTIIAVAHRLSTLKACDKILYMEKGTLLGSGTFSELEKQIPAFAKMIHLSKF